MAVLPVRDRIVLPGFHAEIRVMIYRTSLRHLL